MDLVAVEDIDPTGMASGMTMEGKSEDVVDAMSATCSNIVTRLDEGSGLKEEIVATARPRQHHSGKLGR